MKDAIVIENALARKRILRSLPAPAVRKLIRRQAGVTQAEVAAALGRTQPEVARWESGRRVPGPDVAGAYLALLRRFEKASKTAARIRARRAQADASLEAGSAGQPA